ncbi:hypothetical protein AVEN_53176-1 [Araneus ventricosus]|uniref:Tc1-like transposase DDE domain-containing protein n=1 Tax=Araneus ventricosus TaxID=182803 RepID=A0A4Y2A9M9_ARAVE|nr:hypothetical protein AVEN_53176-1 [Araneus ventricosus]
MNVISDFLEDLPLSDLRNVWFQHDGAPPHKISSVQQYIRETFQQQVVECDGYVEWSPRSPDLNPLDFFSVGIHQAASVCNPSTNITGISKPYYGCLCQRVTCHVVHCAAGSAVPCPDVYCC